MEHPNKKNHSAGTRFLLYGDDPRLFGEYTVLEWSPSGEYLKVSESCGNQQSEWWMEASHYCIKEVLSDADEKVAILVRKFIRKAACKS